MIEDEGRRGLRGSQAEVGWRVRVVLRPRSLSFITFTIPSSTSIQNQSTFSRIFVRRPGTTPDPDSLSEFPACLILYLSLTSSIRIPMRRLARSGAVLTETRLMGWSVRVFAEESVEVVEVVVVGVDMMNRRDADGREACARRLRLLLVIRCFRAVNIAERRSTIPDSCRLKLSLPSLLKKYLDVLSERGSRGVYLRHE